MHFAFICFISHVAAPIPTDAIIELIALILTKNNFTFNEKHFIQIKGTAMSTQIAPYYTNISIKQWDSIGMSCN